MSIIKKVVNSLKNDGIKGCVLKIKKYLKNEEKEEKDKDKYLRREFTSYSFHRSFELPEERYDVAKAQAAYKDGILEVTLPKKEQKDKVSRQIEVK